MMKYGRIIFLVTYALLLSLPLLIAQTESDIVAGFEKRKSAALSILNQKTKKDTTRVNALIKVTNAAFINKQRLELLRYNDEALQLSRKLNYPAGLSQCYLFKANYHSGALEYETAHLFYDSAIYLGINTSDNLLHKYAAEGHRGKAMIYQREENFYKALQHHFETLKYYEGRDTVKAINTCTNITDLYTRANNPTQAVFYAKKTITLAENISDHSFWVQAYMLLSNIYLNQKKIDSAVYYMDKASPFIPVKDQRMLNSGYYILRGEVFSYRREYDSAYNYYKMAYDIAADPKHSFNKTAVLFALSRSALRTGKKDLAKKYADENIEAAEKLKARTGKINALINQAEYYNETGNTASAYRYLRQAYELKDSLNEESNISQINTLAAVFESDKKEKEIMQLQNEKKLQAASTRRKTLINYFLATLAATLIIAGYFAYKNLKKKRQIDRQQQDIQKQKIKELEKHKQLSTINAMLKGQEEERSRIAKDLHDGLGGLLSGTKLSFMHVRDGLPLSADDAARFDKSLSMLDNTIGDLRKIAQNLMPEALVKFGLHEALRDFCDYIQNSSGIRISYQPLGPQRSLDNTASVFIYRIIQELVNNAVKHASAGEIIVQLTMTDNKTRITIEDDGKGFDKSIPSLKNSSGLSNIQYRVNYFSGIWDIVTSPGEGTSVNIELSV